MIGGLKLYALSAKTKPMTRTSELNIPWLRAIPEHWKVVRAKGLFIARTERARPDDEQLSATQAYGVIPQKEFERLVGRKVVQITQHLDKRAHVEPDDFVISMRSFQGGLERAWARGCIRSSYVVLKPSPQTQVGYFAHLFKSVDYIRALQATGNFIRDGQDLNFSNFCLVDLPLPPTDEQADIAKCLDYASRKIDGFVRAKRKLIGLLNEQKQAIIHHAVTRGLRHGVPLKPSGVPWIGDIPKHWEVLRLGRIIKLITGFPFGSDGFSQKDSAIRLLRGINVTPVGLRWDSMVRWERTHSDGLDEFLLEVGDIVLGMDRPIVAAGVRAASVKPSDVPSLLLQRVARLRPKAIITGPFLLLLLQGRLFAEYIAPIFTGISVPHLSPEQIKGFKVMLPPVDEQEEIVASIALQTSALNTAITRTEREIALMLEYRTRLTADIVTGKLDVREAVAKLPELPAASEEELAVNDLSDEIEDESNT